MKPLAPAGSSRACAEAKINTAISEQDLSGVHFFSEVTEEQLHLSGEFNCETLFGPSYGGYLIKGDWKSAEVKISFKNKAKIKLLRSYSVPFVVYFSQCRL